MNKPIKCRRCGQPTVYSPSNPYRPFCSERCQMIDLGAWASEEYKVPTQDFADFNLPDDDNKQALVESIYSDEQHKN